MFEMYSPSILKSLGPLQITLVNGLCFLISRVDFLNSSFQLSSRKYKFKANWCDKRDILLYFAARNLCLLFRFSQLKSACPMRFNRPQSSRLLSHPPKSSCLTSRTTCEFSFVFFSVLARCFTGRTYSRVNFDGTPVERVDKHPFCMARVHYNETDEKVWFQASDQSHRWQQSASEIRIMVSNLPVKAKEIDVFISSESLKISNVATGQIFLEGCLQHRIITEESVWDLDEDEGILTIYLQKMNIELFAKPLDHNASDWTSLFRDSFKITFDDCAKNYQDLPEPVMKLYRIREAKEQECRNIDNRESKERDAARELDDLRRRTRMARLGALRGFSVCNGM